MVDKLTWQYLVEDGLVSQEQLEKALEIQKQRVLGSDSPPIELVLLEMGTIDEAGFEAELAQQARDRVRLYGQESKQE